MNTFPEAIIVTVFPKGDIHSTASVLIEIPYDRVFESYISMAFVTAWLAGHIRQEDDGCDGTATRLCYHKDDLTAMLEDAGQDRVSVLLNATTMDTMFRVDVKWFQ